MESSDELWEQNFRDFMGGGIPFDVAGFSPIPTPPPSKDPKRSMGKAVRRRSRASRNAPTTLLTADASNFRALVQQFTGCHSASTPLIRAYKGPVNLNFKQRNCYPERPQLAFRLHEESDRSFFPFGAKDESPRADALTYDRFDLDKFWGSADCSTVVHGAMNHELW